MSITTTSVLPAPVQQSFSYKLLSVPTPYFIHKIPAMLKQMPRNGGTILRMRRYNPLPSATVPLGNTGILPPPVQLTAVNIDAQMDFYGQYILLNEQVTLQNQDPRQKNGVYKLSLIDLEAQNQGDRAEGVSHGDRLSEKAGQPDATVRTRAIGYMKRVRECRRASPPRNRS